MDIKDLTWEPHPDADKLRESAALAITRVLAWNDIYEHQKERIIHRILLWDLTEVAEKNYQGVRGKYLQIGKKHNLRYWTEEVIDLYDVNRKNKRYKQLRHEHVLERKNLFEFLNRKDYSPSEKIEILSKPENVPACVVTIEENNHLNKIKGVTDWERYKVAKIQIYDRMTGQYANTDILQRKINPMLLN